MTDGNTSDFKTTLTLTSKIKKPISSAKLKNSVDHGEAEVEGRTSTSAKKTSKAKFTSQDDSSPKLKKNIGVQHVKADLKVDDGKIIKKH